MRITTLQDLKSGIKWNNKLTSSKYFPFWKVMIYLICERRIILKLNIIHLLATAAVLHKVQIQTELSQSTLNSIFGIFLLVHIWNICAVSIEFRGENCSDENQKSYMVDFIFIFPFFANNTQCSEISSHLSFFLQCIGRIFLRLKAR